MVLVLPNRFFNNFYLNIGQMLVILRFIRPKANNFCDGVLMGKCGEAELPSSEPSF